ncbi:MAG TPA: DUF819 family protein [Rubricoccaceae bacterium]|nr:DUF819 family protein [Rubricoccaceae bacterium]
MPDAPPAALITEPTALFAYLATLLAGVYALTLVKGSEKFFDVVPPVIWAYFLPMLSTTAGITPATSPAYDWMSRYLLPFSLFLLMITVDFGAIAKLGRLALVMMLVGTLGVVLGGPLAYALFDPLLPDPEAWKGFAALSGSWIGGTANLLAIKESVGASDSTVAPLIVVDTVVGYGWMGILLFLSAYQARFDRWVRADTSAMESVNAALAAVDTERRPSTIATLTVLIGLGFGAAVVSRLIGDGLPALGDPTIISAGTWAVLIAVTAGLVLSFTPMRRLERDGASRIGYVALYLLLTSIGASADLKAVLETPVYLLAGVVWIAFHALLLLLAAKLLRAPLFFVATGSMANIGGAASAPIVAGVYLPAMAPVGLLLAVLGYILGIYAGLGCAWMLGQIAG